MSGERIIAVDPGNKESAWVVLDEDFEVYAFGKQDNEYVRLMLQTDEYDAQRLAIEMMAPRGMPTSREEMEAMVWIGRFIECWNGPFAYVLRREVKSTICGTQRAGDANIRAELIERWGGKKKAIGKKASPGPLYGVKADIWQALALGVTYFELLEQTDASTNTSQTHAQQR